MQRFGGSSGNNVTGGSVGGFEETSSGYVSPYNYDGNGSGRGDRNVYLGYTGKSGSTVNDTLYYASYDAGGKAGQVKTAQAPLSDCQSIYYNGKLVWYVTDNSAPTFYQLDSSGVAAKALGGIPSAPDTPSTLDTPSTPSTPSTPDTTAYPSFAFEVEGGVAADSKNMTRVFTICVSPALLIKKKKYHYL